MSDEKKPDEKAVVKRLDLVSSDDSASRELSVVKPGEVVNAPDETEANPRGLIARYRLAFLRSKKELETADLLLSTQIALLEHEAEARKRESKTYWDARSVEIASTIKTYVQARLRTIEIERFKDRADALEKAYVAWSEKVLQIESNATLPDAAKRQLIDSITASFRVTLSRIEDDPVAKKYDLKD